MMKSRFKNKRDNNNERKLELPKSLTREISSNDDGSSELDERYVVKKGKSRKLERQKKKDEKKKRRQHYHQVRTEKLMNPEKLKRLKIEKEEKIKQEKLAKRQEIEKREEQKARREEKRNQQHSTLNLTEDEKKRIFLKSLGRNIDDLLSNDDKEIKFLESRLGMNKKKNKNKDMPSSFKEDGLDVLFKPVKRPTAENDEDEDVEEEDENGFTSSDKLMDELEDALDGFGAEGEDDETDSEFEADEDDQVETLEDIDVEDEEEDDEEYDEDIDMMSMDEEDDQEDQEDEELEFDNDEDEIEYLTKRLAEEEGDGDDETIALTTAATKKKKEAKIETKEDIYGRVVNAKTGEIIKDNKGVGSEGLGKYVPPHLRNAAAATPSTTTATNNNNNNTKPQIQLSNDDLNLQRKLNGLLNRLATNNFHSIYNEIAQLFNEKPRNILKHLITDLILRNSCSSEQIIHSIIHANTALLAAIHCGIGTDIGGYFIEELYKKYQDAYTNEKNMNLISNLLLSIIHLYNFQVLGSVIIVDLAKVYLDSFTENDIQLLLLLIQNAGYQLRGEDPAALKDLIVLVQKRQADVKKDTDESTVTKLSFMMETITNLKNNKVKNTKLIDTISTLKKAIRSLLKSTETSMSSNTLRISLKDLDSIDSAGRWWLVGSSWAGRVDSNGVISQAFSAERGAPLSQSSVLANVQSTFNNELLKSAAANRMTTPLQKAIFCTLMSADDYIDAFERIMQLQLKDKQDREVVNIILHCCMKEKKFNPYYFHLIQRLTSHDENIRFTLQYAVWDRLKEIPESSVTSIVVLANLVSKLIESQIFTLTLLRVVSLERLDPKSIVFYRVLFTTLLTLKSESETVDLFERLTLIQEENRRSKKKEDQVQNIEQLKKGISVFFMHGLISTSSENSDQLILLKQRVKIVKPLLKPDINLNFL